MAESTKHTYDPRGRKAVQQCEPHRQGCCDGCPVSGCRYCGCRRDRDKCAHGDVNGG